MSESEIMTLQQDDLWNLLQGIHCFQTHFSSYNGSCSDLEELWLTVGKLLLLQWDLEMIQSVLPVASLEDKKMRVFEVAVTVCPNKVSLLVHHNESQRVGVNTGFEPIAFLPISALRCSNSTLFEPLNPPWRVHLYTHPEKKSDYLFVCLKPEYHSCQTFSNCQSVTLDCIYDPDSTVDGWMDISVQSGIRARCTVDTCSMMTT